MATLAEIVKKEVRDYAGSGRGANINLFSVLDDTQQVYAVNSTSFPDRHRPAYVVVMARIVGDKVIIEEDRTDRPLVDALMQAGIPREQIILAYAGEPVPEEA